MLQILGVCRCIVRRLRLFPIKDGGGGEGRRDCNGCDPMRWLTFLCSRPLQSADLNTSAKFKNKYRCAAYDHCLQLILSQICKKTPRMLLSYFFDQLRPVKYEKQSIFREYWTVKCPNCNLFNKNSNPLYRFWGINTQFAVRFSSIPCRYYMNAFFQIQWTFNQSQNS